MLLGILFVLSSAVMNWCEKIQFRILGEGKCRLDRVSGKLFIHLRNSVILVLFLFRQKRWDLGRRCRYHHSIFFFPIWLFVLFGNMNMDLYLLDLVLLTICYVLITVVRIELSFLEWMFCWWSSCFCILALLEWEIVIFCNPDMSNQFRPKLSNSTSYES